MDNEEKNKQSENKVGDSAGEVRTFTLSEKKAIDRAEAQAFVFKKDPIGAMDINVNEGIALTNPVGGQIEPEQHAKKGQDVHNLSSDAKTDQDGRVAGPPPDEGGSSASGGSSDEPLSKESLNGCQVGALHAGPMSVPPSFKRYLAAVLDSILLIFLMTPYLLYKGVSFLKQGGQFLELNWFELLLIPAFIFSYELFFMHFFSALPAQRLFNLRVVRCQDGVTFSPLERVPLMDLFIRVLAQRLSLFFGWGIYVTAWFSTQRRHFAEVLSNTRIVQPPGFSGAILARKTRPILATILILYSALGATSSALVLVSKINLSGAGIKIELTGFK